MKRPSALSDGIKEARTRKRIFARKLRKEMLPHAVILWDWLRTYPLGFKFRRESVRFGYIVDFYCASKRLAIELDSSWHDPKRDAERDRNLKARGITTARFWWSDVHSGLPNVQREILRLLRTLVTHSQANYG